MSNKFLHRDDAPFTDKVWEKIDETAVNAARSQLCGRRLLHTKGPYGFGLKTLPGGEVQVEQAKAKGAELSSSCAVPLGLIRMEFTLSISDIAAFEQSGTPLDLSPVSQAAIACAHQEDDLIFNGSKNLGLQGLFTFEAAQSVKLKSWNQLGAAAENIIDALTKLDDAGFHGPYALALAPKLYNMLYRRYPQGNATEHQHIREMITDGIVKAPVLKDGGILINSSESFASIVLGQDLSTAFIGPAAGKYEFVVQESLALWLTQPKALCRLK